MALVAYNNRALGAGKLFAAVNTLKNAWDRTARYREQAKDFRDSIRKHEENMPRKSSGKRKRTMKKASSVKARRLNAIQSVASGPVGRMPRGIRASRVKLPVLRCMSKGNYHGDVSGSSIYGAVYVTHATHPPKWVLRHLGMSIVDYYFRKVGCPIQAWDRSMSQFAIFNDAQFHINVIYQDRDDGQFVGHAASYGPDYRYISIADSIADMFANLCDADSADFKMHTIEIHVDAAGGAPTYHPHVYLMAADIKIGILGISELDVQNRTVAGGGSSTDSALSIYANPLEGKSYVTKGLNAIMAIPGGTGTGLVNPFLCDTTTGLYSNRYDGSNMPPGASDILKLPPHPRVFKGLVRSGSLTLAPGVITKSRLSKYVVKSLNGWLALLKHWLGTGTTTVGSASAPGSTAGALIKKTDFSMGLNCVIALDKVCNLGNAVPVVAFERTADMRSRMWYRSKGILPATNTDLLAQPDPV